MPEIPDISQTFQDHKSYL